ncbi:WYL domain-containing protein [Leptospira wolffii]|uniref:Transcriptional regulator n=1 Tax=Leptospira wolffii TaxID=409998 RepID=A0A2M9Z972_9LEPT|nr:WYL domain-containing protein [Leptospira wolffii]PJZ64979.1 transcriptional regulator [Leptospira wolffii]TGK58114.1 WYL domain-containing protein [Leptospira wolffii]TGK68793.1 WYL domain-containing protein [Leptospira wolffii]TGK76367.1 WYL domain-containing protein [Leptospira wolffii]TGL27145.1 WYL domain-containing protein [Leptospira wolffii]
MKEELDKDLDPEIEPREMNPTEYRLLTLLFHFFRFPDGLTLSSLRKIMEGFYDNENKDSDRRKLSRDIEELESLGFHIKYYPQKNGKDFVYVLSKDPLSKSLQFSEEELREISALLLKGFSESPKYELYTAARKIFAGDLSYYPELGDSASDSEEEAGETAFAVLDALKNKVPIRIRYYKNFPEDSYLREVDPIRLIRKRGSDHYLLAYDREDKERKRFILPKIQSVEVLQGDFLYQSKGAKRETEEDLIVHAALFPVHGPKEVQWICKEEGLVKTKLFLSGIEYKEEGNRLSFRSTNLEGLLPFLWRWPEAIETISPPELNELYQNSIKQTYKLYETV